MTMTACKLSLYFKDADKEVPLSSGETVITRALLEDIYARDTQKVLTVRRFCSRSHFKIYCDRYGGIHITPLGSNGLSYELENKCVCLPTNTRLQIDPDRGPFKLFLFRNGLPIYLKGIGKLHPDLQAPSIDREGERLSNSNHFKRATRFATRSQSLRSYGSEEKNSAIELPLDDSDEESTPREGNSFRRSARSTTSNQSKTLASRRSDPSTLETLQVKLEEIADQDRLTTRHNSYGKRARILTTDLESGSKGRESLSERVMRHRSRGAVSGRETSADSYEEEFHTPTFTPCKRQKLENSQLKVEISQSGESPFMRISDFLDEHSNSERRRRRERRESRRAREEERQKKDEEAIINVEDDEEVKVKDDNPSSQKKTRMPLSDRKRRYTPIRTRRMAKLFMKDQMTSDDSQEQRSCPICLNEISQEDEALLKCNHRFCSKCIQDWAKVTNKCPLCKSEFAQIEIFLNGKFMKAIPVETKILQPEDFEPYLEEYEDQCVQCQSSDDAPSLLLCDSCDQGYHMYCLRPSLRYIPTDNWYCPECVRDDGILISEYLGPEEYHAFLESVDKPEFEFFLDFTLYTRLLNERRRKQHKTLKELFYKYISHHIQLTHDSSNDSVEERPGSSHYNLRRIESISRDLNAELDDLAQRLKDKEDVDGGEPVDIPEDDEDSKDDARVQRPGRSASTYNLRELSVPEGSKNIKYLDLSSDLGAEDDIEEIEEEEEEAKGDTIDSDENRVVTRSLTLKVTAEDIGSSPEVDTQASHEFSEIEIDVESYHPSSTPANNGESRRVTRSRSRPIHV